VQRGGMLSYRIIGAAAVVVVLVGTVVVGITVRDARNGSAPRGPGAGTSTPSTTRPAPNVPALRAALAASLRFVPAAGSTSVAPDSPIVVTAGTNRLSAVRVTSSGGDSVGGGLEPSGHEWRSSGSLAYGADYRVTATVAATAAGEPNVTAESTVTFRTLSPAATVTASVFPNEGLTIGVGQPVVFRFSQAITDPGARQNVLAHLSVTESKPVVGGWYWFSPSELHFRPQAFWPTGEHVTVDWNLTGWNAGGGNWGADRGLVHFGTGHARVSYANLTTHTMTVTDNGRVVATYPISGGKPADPTMAGVHIVLDRQSVVHMVSSTNGIPVNSPDGYDELVYDDVHISDTGEYVHAAPWSVGSQGHTNVSHGCINLSPANARAFFEFSRVGDVVLVVGSPRPPVVGDHGVMDWDTGFSAFTPANVIVKAPAGLPFFS
jgi:lipoprotein-anchoring transpeptidase ErfK/SrfK